MIGVPPAVTVADEHPLLDETAEGALSVPAPEVWTSHAPAPTATPGVMVKTQVYTFGDERLHAFEADAALACIVGSSASTPKTPTTTACISRRFEINGLKRKMHVLTYKSRACDGSAW